MTRPPDWWTTLERSFGAMLETPLDVRSGRRISSPVATAPVVVAAVLDDAPGAEARLRLYHEQYWSRFFITFQRIFKRSAPLFGFWEFNALVTQHLTENPPSCFDLSDAAVGFFSRCEATLKRARDEVRPGVATQLVRQALNLDEAERRAFGAQPPQVRPELDVGRAMLPGARARQRDGVSLLRLEWDLVDGPPDDAPAFHPSRLATPEHWVVGPGPGGVELTRVDALTARLLARSRVGSIADAIAHVVDACGPDAHDAVTARVPGLLGRIIAAGWWTAIDVDDRRGDAAAVPAPERST